MTATITARGLLVSASLFSMAGCANLAGFDSEEGPSPTERRFMALEAKAEITDRHERVLKNLDLVSSQQKLQQQEEELRNLRGIVEQLQYQSEESKQRQRQLYLDLDRRLAALEGGSPSAAGSSSSNTITRQETPAAGEEQAYLRAFDVLKAGQFNPAIKDFQAFLQKHPNSSYADNAQYWIGEAHYVSRRFAEAQNEFSKVLKNYPNSQKAPDALLKLGYIQNELGDANASRATLARVITEYPNSTAAKLAEKRLSPSSNP